MALLLQSRPAENRAWVWHFVRDGLRPTHFHDDTELMLVRRGRGLLECWGATFALARGDLVVVPPGVPHGFLQLSADFDMWGAEVGPELLGAMHGSRHDAAPFAWVSACFARGAFATPVVRLSPTDYRELEQAYARLDGAEGSEVAALLERLLCCVRRHGQGEEGIEARGVRQQLHEPHVDRAELARGLRVCPEHLSRAFRQRLGCTWEAQRGRARVLAFLAHSAGPGANLTEAAYAAGFGSYSQLFRTFRACAGASPHDYVFGAGRALRGQLVDATRIAVPGRDPSPT
jgi:AraC-like DNA-binding protein